MCLEELHVKSIIDNGFSFPGEETDETSEEPIQCGGCDAPTDACHCQAITNTFCQVNRYGMICILYLLLENEL